MMDIQLGIEGVADEAIAAAIRKRVRKLGRLIAEAGECRVSVCPSETRGEWDLGVQTPSGWHLESFSEVVDRLPEIIDRKLRERLMAPVSSPLTT